MPTHLPSDAELQGLAERLGECMFAAGMQLALAESCTGGWVAKIVTDIVGSSSWFDRGFVTYTNESKQALLGVPAETLATEGAVSAMTVAAMARGALARSHAQLSCAISGIAGPGGATPGKPVGLVWFAWGVRDGDVRTEQQIFAGDREAVRRQAVAHALRGLLDVCA
ncbi:MAG: nicotinamide-nucleotide amidohydrolase family protein [Gammaproteobacteria bacterium]|nr:nicotinamide-nucleotide amidohydrolase family protein [Gammaproteobacteria bacterium]